MSAARKLETTGAGGVRLRLVAGGKRDLRARKATDRNIQAYCEAEHLAIFGREWSEIDERILTGADEQPDPFTNTPTLAVTAAEPRRKAWGELEPRSPNWQRRVAADRARVAAALARLRHAARGASNLLAKLQADWEPEHDEGDWEGLLAVWLPELQRLLSRLPEEFTAKKPMMRFQRTDMRLRKSVVFTTYRAGHAMKPHTLAILSLLCGERPSGDVVKAGWTVGQVVAVEADTMRKVRDRFLASFEGMQLTEILKRR